MSTTAITALRPLPSKGTGDHVLVVADWVLDPHAVVAELVRRSSEREVTWSLLATGACPAATRSISPTAARARTRGLGNGAPTR